MVLLHGAAAVSRLPKLVEGRDGQISNNYPTIRIRRKLRGTKGGLAPELSEGTYIQILVQHLDLVALINSREQAPK